MSEVRGLFFTNFLRREARLFASIETIPWVYGVFAALMAFHFSINSVTDRYRSDFFGLTAFFAMG